jgi:hypothetical protein
MSADYDYLVETDIANFFPYVDIAGVCDHVRLNSNLADDTVRLLEHMLRSFSPMRGYRSSRVGGLPQEPFDCSRILAHTYLLPLDREFEVEGNEKRFSRWVDDVVIGAKSTDEALQQVSRAQTVLEPLALYPNSAKTRIIPTADFTKDYMKDENDYLGEVEEGIGAGTHTASEFRRRLRRHVRITPRPKAWARVLRRYYTASRHLRDRYLLNWWADHIVQSPDSAANILEYALTYPLSLRRLKYLRGRLETFAGVYEDVDLLAIEYVISAPNAESAELRRWISDWAKFLIDSSKKDRPRLAAASVVALGKFGYRQDMEWLHNLYVTELVGDSPVRQQAMSVLFGAGLIDEAVVRRSMARSTIESVQHAEYVLALLRGEDDAVGHAIGLVQPSRREQPTRWAFRPRALFLAPVARRSAHVRWKKASAGWLMGVATDPREFRDRAAERWLRRRQPA